MRRCISSVYKRAQKQGAQGLMGTSQVTAPDQVASVAYRGETNWVLLSSTVELVSQEGLKLHGSIFENSQNKLFQLKLSVKDWNSLR